MKFQLWEISVIAAYSFLVGWVVGFYIAFLLLSRTKKEPKRKELNSNWEKLKSEKMPSEKVVLMAEEMDAVLAGFEEANRVKKLTFLYTELKDAKTEKGRNYLLDEINKLRKSKDNV